jgi:uncharacterized membrane protein
MRQISEKAKQQALFAGTSLLVAFVRNRLQYGKGWVSLNDFALSWLVHYFGVFLAIGFSAAVIARYSAFLLGVNPTRKEPEMTELMVYCAITISVCTAFILLLSAWPSSDPDF